MSQLLLLVLSEYASTSFGIGGCIACHLQFVSISVASQDQVIHLCNCHNASSPYTAGGATSAWSGSKWPVRLLDLHGLEHKQLRILEHFKVAMPIHNRSPGRTRRKACKKPTTTEARCVPSHKTHGFYKNLLQVVVKQLLLFKQKKLFLFKNSNNYLTTTWSKIISFTI